MTSSTTAIIKIDDFYIVDLMASTVKIHTIKMTNSTTTITKKMTPT